MRAAPEGDLPRAIEVGEGANAVAPGGEVVSESLVGDGGMPGPLRAVLLEEHGRSQVDPSPLGLGRQVVEGLPQLVVGEGASIRAATEDLPLAEKIEALEYPRERQRRNHPG